MDKFVCIECTVKAASDNHARSIFNLASSRLLHAHDWSHLTDSLLLTSEHRDAHGAPVSRAVEADDYINLTDEEQRPFGWMQVVDVVQSTTGQNGEVAVVTLPVGLPFDDDDKLTEAGRKPTLLRVVRRGLDVTAAFVMESYPFTTAFERLGVYMVQWRSLVNGLLSDLTPIDANEHADKIPSTRFA